MKPVLCLIVANVLVAGACVASEYESSPYEVPKGLVKGASFIDLIEPVPIRDGLTQDVWGGDNVKPRDANNGIEDSKWSYWCNSVIKGPDGKEHMFACRWLESSPKGHHEWPDSLLVHAVSDSPTGPFKVIQEMGSGHNAEVYRAKDWTYVVYVIDACYQSKSLGGPWVKTTLDFDNRGRKEVNMSNMTFTRREDGSFLMVSREGQVWISQDGLKPFRMVRSESIYPNIRGSFEDPVVWRDDVQYHLIVNDWFGRTAYYLRSLDGLNWTWDPGKAYDQDVVRHPDGTKEGWFKIERPKVRQDEQGRATHIYFAVIDSPKDDDRPNDNHSSKGVALPLTLAPRMKVLNPDPITPATSTIEVEILDEPELRSLSEIDVPSLRFGDPEAVSFGKGASATGSRMAGSSLIVTFDGLASGLNPKIFAGKLLGRTTRGGLIHGYVRMPGHLAPVPLLSSTKPELRRNPDGKVVIAAGVENFGLGVSAAAVVKYHLAEGNRAIADGEITVDGIEPSAGRKFEIPLAAQDAEPGQKVTLQLVIDGGQGAGISAELVIP